MSATMDNVPADPPSVWDQMGAGLGAGASAVAILAAAWGLLRIVRTLWRRSIGRRRAQSRILDQLACQSSVVFVESLLGVARFVEHHDGVERRLYRLPGAWVAIELQPDKPAVATFSITITDSSMYYSTNKLTFDLLDIRLGKDKFSELKGLGLEPDGEHYWLGANRAGYLRRYWFGNPGGYQWYWLSWNLSGAGDMVHQHPNGLYRSGAYAQATDNDAESFDSSQITANTLTVAGPYSDNTALMAREVLGADYNTTRLARE
jgi:hypothetical protein